MANSNMMPDVRSERHLWSPLREINRMQRRLDRIFDEMMGGSLPSLGKSTDFFPSLEETQFIPACDVEETDSHYLITFDLPGMKKEDVRIEVQDNQLIVSGERKHEHKENKQGRMSRERYYGTFSRSFALPSNMNPEKIEANYENGVLQVAVPKTQATTGTQIPVKEGKLITAKSGKAA